MLCFHDLTVMIYCQMHMSMCMHPATTIKGIHWNSQYMHIYLYAVTHLYWSQVNSWDFLVSIFGSPDDPYCMEIYLMVFTFVHTQLMEILGADDGYCQPPPPGCPREIYRIMVECWWVQRSCIVQPSTGGLSNGVIECSWSLCCTVCMYVCAYVCMYYICMYVLYVCIYYMYVCIIRVYVLFVCMQYSHLKECWEFIYTVLLNTRVITSTLYKKSVQLPCTGLNWLGCDIAISI